MTVLLARKADLRRLYRSKRGQLSASDIAQLSRRVAERFFDAMDLRDVSVLSTFIGIPKLNEIDTSEIYNRVWHDLPHVTTVAPVTDLVTGNIENVPFTSESPLAESSWGIREPIGNAIDPLLIDMVLVPMLAFDERGHRVGYGRGLYDRFLSRCRADCKKIGLSFFEALAEPFDPNEHDVPLDACVTPSQTYWF